MSGYGRPPLFLSPGGQSQSLRAVVAPDARGPGPARPGGVGTCPGGVGSPVPREGGLFGPVRGEVSCLAGAVWSVCGNGSSVRLASRLGLAGRCPVSQQPTGRLSSRIQKSRFWMEPGFFRVLRRSGFFCFRFSFPSPLGCLQPGLDGLGGLLVAGLLE